MSGPAQVINVNGDFALPETWGPSDFRRSGLVYHVVGAFGAQSSGKSTLLNALFGTNFVTLTDSSARCRTTNGAFLTTAADDGSVLAMDFEGTDGSERGDDSTFERQLCLFALSVADVLLLNMWSTDVGRFNAANLSLLRTVFEVRLQLSRHEVVASVPNRVALLFVIRDHSGDADRAGAKILADLRTLWHGMHKPPEFSDMGIEDFFVPQFVALPHFEFQRPQFDQAVLALRRRFAPDHPQSVMTSGRMLHDVPAEALSKYMRQCWVTIRSNEDLDLPSQRQMIAEYRCTALCDSLRQKFDERCAEEISTLTAEARTSAHEALREDMATAVDKFNAASQLYAPSVVTKFREKLRDSLAAGIHKVIDQQVMLIAAGHVRSLEHFVSNSMEDAMGLIATDAHTPATHNTKKVVDSFWMQVVEQTRKVVASWAKSLECRGALADDELREGVVRRVEGDLRAFLRRLFDGAAADINGTMNRVFERTLKYDAYGTQCSFGSEKDLKRAIGPARYGGYMALACFQRWRLADSWELKPQPYLRVPIESATDEGAVPSEGNVSDDDAVLVSTASLPHIVAMFRQHVQHTFELQRAVIQSGGHVPLWMWGLLILLGYDEMWYVVTNPVLVIFFGMFLYMYCHAAVARTYAQLKAAAPPAAVGVMAAAESYVASCLGAPDKPKKD